MTNVASMHAPGAGSRHVDAAADRRAAERVLGSAASAIQAISAGLDDDFIRAVDVLYAVRGRVVATGMGKSGHIAKKFAATVASTGTPALYVHPAEASHGDLGMITSADALVALSNSGETPELGDLVAFAGRYGIPLVALTAVRDSTLAKQADVALILPPLTEACPMGLAPTTSTTAMLVLGDALAVALLERRGFTEDDFRSLHPGGKLGQRLLHVGELMHSGDEVPLVTAGTVMADAILTMTERRFGCVGVTDAQGRLIGVVTDGDLRRKMAPDLLAQTVGSVMTAAPLTIRSDALAATALGFMNDSNITALFVVDGEAPSGIVHIHDCLRAGLT